MERPGRHLGPGYAPRYFLLTQVVSLISLVWLIHANLTALERGGWRAWLTCFPFPRVWRQQWVRYACVGVLIAALYLGLAVGVSRLLPGWPLWLVSGVSLLGAIALQYAFHAGLTFQRRLDDVGQRLRFGFVTLSGLTVSTLITTAAPALTGWSPLFLFALVSVTIPVVNYLLFSLWVFTHR